MARQRPATRLDVELVSRGLAPSRERAQALVAAGLVEVDGAPGASSDQRVGAATALVVRGRDHPWAGRGGLKLAAALDAFGVYPAGRVCIDAGASTGGFTDVLLSRGAASVHAIDVGKGQLDSRLAADPRVTVRDRTNLRLLTSLPGPRPDLATLDLSFISLRVVLPAVTALLARPAEIIALFKPQFELGREAVGRGGIVRDAALTQAGMEELMAWAASELNLRCPSAPVAAAVRGAKGNQEHFLHLVAEAAA